MSDVLENAPEQAPEAPAGREGDTNAADFGKEGVQAEEGAEKKEPPQDTNDRSGEASPLGWLVPIAIIFAIMYLMLIRPQKKRDQQRKEMLGTLKKDDEIVTIGGIIGVVTSVNDREIVLRLEDNTKIRLTRAAVSKIVNKEEAQ